MIGILDCNNFFVSCERLFRPDLLKKPVAVLSSNDGCVVARSQEVKDLDIPMGVPYFQVKETLSKAGAVFFSSNFALYRDISARVMNILMQEVGFCEVYSIDEAFFNVPDSVTEAEVLAIRATVMRHTGIPVSIGVAHTKTLAKQASKIAKKRTGVCVLDENEWKRIAQETPCSTVWGIGRQTSIRLLEMGIMSVAAFLALDRTIVRRSFGVIGERLQNELQGISVYHLGDHHGEEDTQQSIMSTRSFAQTTSTLSALQSAIGYHVTEVAQKLREKKLLASRMTLLVLPSRHGDFFLHSLRKEIVFTTPVSDTQTLLSAAIAGLQEIFQADVPYKKAGIVVSGLQPSMYEIASLFEDTVSTEARKKIDTVTDALKERFGNGIVRSGIVLTSGARGSAKLRSKAYTTQWKDIPSVYAK